MKWFDNKPVILASTYVSGTPVETIKRFDKRQRAKIDIPCPSLIKLYNALMGGVDLMDMLVRLYISPLKTRRWYLSIFAQMLDICINNAWLFYRREKCILEDRSKEYSLKYFRQCIAEALIQNRKGRKTFAVQNEEYKKIKKPVLPRPSEEVRCDKVDHFPIYGTKGRCRYCKSRETHWSCSKCVIRLCLVKDRNCFIIAHKDY